MDLLQLLLTMLDSEGCTLDVLARDGDVPGSRIVLILALFATVRGKNSQEKDAHAATAGGNLRVTVERAEDVERPRLDGARLEVTDVVEVDADQPGTLGARGTIQDEADAVEGALAVSGLCVLEPRPRPWVRGTCPPARTGV